MSTQTAAMATAPTTAGIGSGTPRKRTENGIANGREMEGSL